MEEISLNEYNSRPKPAPKSKHPTIPPRAGLAVLGVVLLAASFLGGVEYQKGKTPTTTTSQTASSSQQGGSQFGGRSGAGGFSRGNRAIGTVSAVSSSSITVQTRQGTASTYAITSGTTVTNGGSSASVSDIQTGDTVFITLDSSNTSDASSIALNPSFGGGMGDNSSSGTDDNSGDSTDSGASST